MFIFNEESVRSTLTPWGMEVKKRLIDRGLKQQDLVDRLSEKGFKVNKATLSQMLKGIGIGTRMAEVHEINVILEIKESA